MVNRPNDAPAFRINQLLRDDRFWKITFQVITLVVVLALLGYFFVNLNVNLTRQGINFGFGFLSNSAGFSIGESALEYEPQDTYGMALFVGFVNTLTLVVVGIALAAIVGITAGISSFSQNWLVHKISRGYVGLTRNVPLLLQLFFWYFAIYGQLPRPENQVDLGGLIFGSKRGIYIPWPSNATVAWAWLGVLLVGAIAAYWIWRWRTRLIVEQGASGRSQLMMLGVMAVLALAIVVFGLGWEAPQPDEGSSITGGLKLSREYAAALTALVFYTGAFIAEIVRAGIQSVSKGQWEAARSVGLSAGLTMRLVVFPQAMRVIIPPLNSEFANLAKNSSLAFAIAYPELYSVANTTFNQTGRPVEVFILLMATYLIINLLISLGMNQLNQAVQFKER